MVSSTGLFSSVGKAKHTPDDSCRDTVWSAILLTSPVCTVPSFSYNRPVQLKRTYNYVHMRVPIQVTIINSLPLHSHIHTETVACRHTFLRPILSPQFYIPLGILY
ncbi:unnamed protein product [Hymenolepis diminuta]|uniref:Uncharacterized protein n=1 Tax=Hymenolepis diminuta TaxID=6216 RepID=A0A564YB53_HYMDI|nr:unnamed protein product [Hymenolepis diminuta]